LLNRRVFEQPNLSGFVNIMKRIFVVSWLALAIVLSGFAPARAVTYPGKISGALSILNASELPAGATFTINLLQELPDMRPFALGTQMLTITDSAQALAYEVAYDPALVDARFTYYVDAMIYVGNDLRWVTTGDTSVLTRGRPIDKMDLRLVPLRPPALPQQTPAESMIDVLRGDGRFLTLLGLLQDAGLQNALESGNTQSTLFAPTDDAFERLPAGALDNLRKDKAQLRRVLRYHLVAGRLLSSAVKLRAALSTQDARRRILVRPVNDVIRINNRAAVVQPDLQARNGVIHAISEVLLPPK
jgi:uncharacterized surface protein with fasciclin (FAS1) repeats/uncharacterized lipoprotein YbaY